MELINRPKASPVEITVIGGCHVNGYLVGKENSFVSVCSKILEGKGISNETSTHIHVNFKQSERISRICDESDADIIILQLGNYTFSPSLLNKLRKKWRKKRSESSSSSIYVSSNSHTSLAADINGVFRPSFSFYLNQWIKHIINCCIFYQYLNKRKCIEFIDAAFSAVKSSKASKVIVLSPLPTYNIITNKYRRIGGRWMQKKSAEYEFEFIDVFEAIEKWFGKRNFTLDEMHLRKDAHQFLGEIVADSLLSDINKRNTIKVFLEEKANLKTHKKADH